MVHIESVNTSCFCDSDVGYSFLISLHM